MKFEQECFFIGDSALYTAANLQSLGAIRWLTRVPETLAEAKAWLAEIEPGQMIELADGYAYKEVSSNYAGIVQRWLVVFHPWLPSGKQRACNAGWKKQLKWPRKPGAS